jgi:hypothetical protein
LQRERTFLEAIARGLQRHRAATTERRHGGRARSDKVVPGAMDRFSEAMRKHQAGRAV